MVQETVEKMHKIAYMILGPALILSWEELLSLNRCKYLGKPGLSES